MIVETVDSGSIWQGRKRKGKRSKKPVAVEAHTLTNWKAKDNPPVLQTVKDKFVDVNKFSILEDEPCIEDENIYTEARTLRKKLESHSSPSNVKGSCSDAVLAEQNCIVDEKEKVEVNVNGYYGSALQNDREQEANVKVIVRICKCTI